MRTIGIDLAVTAAHKAIVFDDATGKYVTKVWSFHARWEEIVALVTRAREGVAADHPLRAVLEPTGMAWFTVTVPLPGEGFHLLRVYTVERDGTEGPAAEAVVRVDCNGPRVVRAAELWAATVEQRKRLIGQRPELRQHVVERRRPVGAKGPHHHHIVAIESEGRVGLQQRQVVAFLLHLRGGGAPAAARWCNGCCTAPRGCRGASPARRAPPRW